MRKIPLAHKNNISNDPFFKECARKNDGSCKGRITIEHALIYAGRQISEMWNYVPLCEYHHDVNTQQGNGDLNKEKNVWIALNRAEKSDLDKYSKAINYVIMRENLNRKYGIPTNKF